MILSCNEQSDKNDFENIVHFLMGIDHLYLPDQNEWFFLEVPPR